MNTTSYFGANAFNGQERWLQAQVQCPDDSSLVTLSRQRVNAAPYALFAAAPWLTIDNNIAYTKGYVGIGTTTPARRPWAGRR